MDSRIPENPVNSVQTRKKKRKGPRKGKRLGKGEWKIRSDSGFEGRYKEKKEGKNKKNKR